MQISKILARSFFKNKKGQTTVEVVLLLPIFLIFALFIAKIFALLVLVQKMEVASFYAGRRWQLESHRNVEFVKRWDNIVLRNDIERKVKSYIGFTNPVTKKFLSLNKVTLNIERTQLWNVVTLSVATKPPGFGMICKYDKRKVCKKPYGDKCFKGYNFMCESGAKIEVIKYVPNRDRPIPFVLPTNKKIN